VLLQANALASQFSLPNGSVHGSKLSSLPFIYLYSVTKHSSGLPSSIRTICYSDIVLPIVTAFPPALSILAQASYSMLLSIKSQICTHPVPVLRKTLLGTQSYSANASSPSNLLEVRILDARVGWSC
jgi:hypothetical protein